MSDLKICSKCLHPKSHEEFATDSRLKSGKKNICKLCDNLRSSQYQKDNLVSVLAKNRNWYRANPDKVIGYRSRINNRNKQRYSSDASYRKRRQRSAYDYRSNPDNKLVINVKKRELRDKYAKNPLWRIVQNLRRRLNFALHGQRKVASTMRIVGCDAQALRSHLEALFVTGMSWDNYGQWHIDHIKPCTQFDMSIPTEQYKCFHYSNLQPLWAKDNLSKGGRII